MLNPASMRKIVLITGGFDPVHSGHLEYIKSACELGDTLVVGVNSDEWLTRKKGQPFMPLSERKAIIAVFYTHLTLPTKRIV